MAAWLIIAVAVAVIIAIVGATVCIERIRGLNAMYGQLAERYGGQLTPAGLFQHPAVQFPFRGSTATVGTEQAGRNQQQITTVLQMPWPDRDLLLEVRPHRPYTILFRLLGIQGIKTGAAHFDLNYQVQGNDPQRIRRLLHAGVQSHVDQLRHLTVEHDLQLVIASGQLAVRKRCRIPDLAALLRFTALGLELYEQALIGEMEGIQIVSERLSPRASDASCRVCGDGIGDDVVYCERCLTPHHHDCWTYNNGSCSIYGCGGTRYLAGRRAVRVLRDMQSQR